VILIDENGNPLNFNNEKEAEAFCKWYLRITVDKVADEYSEEEWELFLKRRERRLKVAIDDLSKLHLESAITSSVNKCTYYKIVSEKHKNPLSSQGSFKSNSRFNYKNNELFRNRVIYFGQDKYCCYSELFHLAIQRSNYAQLIERQPSDVSTEFKPLEYKIYEYTLPDLDNILVLTTEATYKALRIPDRVVKDEWFSINDEFEIPTAGQLLGTIARINGYKGIMYTSVRDQTKSNLVLFEENVGELKIEHNSEVILKHENFQGR
jgi:hypothetical protein